jgi:tetratricopeptide (TPR) repeat protein
MPNREEADLRAALNKLLEAELLVPVEPAALDGFMFRHALIQDAAYGTLLRNERRGLHARIAQALEAQFPERAAAEPEVVADHFARADLAESATRYWLRAGLAAGRRWALVEAQRHLAEGLKLAASVKEGREREHLELQLHMALGPVTMATKGYAAQESLVAFERAAPLVTNAGSVSERLLFLLGLFNVRYGRAELAEALRVAQEYCALSERHGQELGRAQGLLGQTYAAMGAFQEADAAFQRSLDIYAREPEDVANLYAFGSQHVISLALSGGLQFGLGKPELGRARMEEAIERAEGINHALSIALARVTQLLSPVPGGVEPDLERAEEVVRYCARYGLANFEAWARFAQGAIIARRGDPARAIVVMRAAIDAAEAMNSRLFRPVHLATLAAAHARLGEMDEALAFIGEAVETAERSGERRADSALHRARGELLAAVGRREDAARAFAQALEIARRQKAMAEEDRARRAVAKLGSGT